MLPNNIHQVTLPLPFALSSVNVYLLRDDDGWTVLDTGLHTAEGEAAWRAAFTEFALDPREIRRIIVSHFHPDHYGMAGWLQSLSGAPVLMTPREAELAAIVWQRSSDELDPMEALFLRHGLSSDLVTIITGEMRLMRQRVQPLADITPLDINRPLVLAGREFQPLIGPGHSDGQLLLYNADKRLLFVGDHVLQKITPHIGRWPETAADPLARYLASLQELRSLEVALALTGHRTPITTWAQRIDELLAHHETRLRDMLAEIEQSAQAVTVAQRVFPFERFTPHEQRFALAETIAHLDELVRRGQLTRADDAENCWYQRA